MRQEETSQKNKKYRCWISEEEGILSFSHVKGYKLKEFNSQNEMIQYCYYKTYKGFRVQ